MRTLLTFSLVATLLVGCARPRAASAPTPTQPTVPTELVVHVVTHDAKLIGSAVGGVRITVRDVDANRVLATGLHEGATGDTTLIMETPRERGQPLFNTADGARFQATLPLRAATLVEVTADGPLGYPEQMAQASKRLVLVPGRHLTGDGLVLEMHGYLLDVLTPDATLTIAANAPSKVRARVRMLCSCPTSDGGMWKVDEVRARLLRDGVVTHDVLLPYAGVTSEYAAELPALAAGQYTLEIVAASPAVATFGVVRRVLAVR